MMAGTLFEARALLSVVQQSFFNRPGLVQNAYDNL